MTMLAISEVRRDGGTQTRESLDYGTVTDYADAMTEGAKFPPVTVYYDGTDYWLADGFHRVAAAKQIGTIQLAADVHQGSRRDAVLHSVGANTEHGLRRSNKDKRRAVETLLRDDEWRQWSDREIARRANVHHKTVEKIRRELTGDLSSESAEPRTYTTKHGTTATMNTINIGRQSAQEYWEAHKAKARTESDQRKPNEQPGRAQSSFYEPEESFTTTVDDAVKDIKRYVSETVEELGSLSERHAVVNEIIKHLRTLSIKYNQQAS